MGICGNALTFKIVLVNEVKILVGYNIMKQHIGRIDAKEIIAINELKNLSNESKIQILNLTGVNG